MQRVVVFDLERAARAFGWQALHIGSVGTPFPSAPSPDGPTVDRRAPDETAPHGQS